MYGALCLLSISDITKFSKIKYTLDFREDCSLFSVQCILHNSSFKRNSNVGKIIQLFFLFNFIRVRSMLYFLNY